MAILSLNKILASKVQSQLAGSASVLIKTIMDLSAEVLDEKQDRVTIPRMSGLTLKDVTPGVRSVGDTYTTDGDELLLNQSKEVSAYLTYNDEANSTVDRQAAFFQGAPRKYAQGVEQTIAAALETSGPNDFASSAAEVSGKINFSINDLAKAKRKLDEQNVDKSERYCGGDAEIIEIMSSFPEFQDAQKSMSDEALREGKVSKAKGFTVVQSEDLAPGKITCWHKESVAFAVHKSMQNIVKVIEEESQVFIALRGKYGCKLLDGGKRKATITATAAGV